MRNISIKGIVVGVIVILVADIIGAIALHATICRGIPLAELYTNTEILLWSILIGTATTILGGYITAKIAKTCPYINALLLGLIGIIIGIFTEKDYPLWFNLVGFITVVPATLLGAYLSKSKAKSNT